MAPKPVATKLVMFPTRRAIIWDRSKYLTSFIALLVRLLRSSGGGLVLAGRRSSSRRSSSGVRIGVGNAVLELIDLGPAVVSLEGDGDGVLVGVDQRVHDGSQGGEVGGQGDGADGADGRLESGQELFLANIQDVGAEDLTVVVDLSNGHTIGEGRDVEHVQQGGLRGADLSTGHNELELADNFNGTTSNLGGNTEGLEERSLVWWHTSVSSWNENIQGSNGTSTSRGRDSVLDDLLADLLQVLVGEDEADIALTST